MLDFIPPAYLFNIRLLLLLLRFSCVQFCVTPYTAAHQASPSLGFSRQEHWSGFLLQCMKVKSESEVAQPCPTLCDPMDCQTLPSMGFSRQEHWNGWPWPSLNYMYQFSSVQFSCSVVSDPLQPHESQHARPPCPSPTPRVGDLLEKTLMLGGIGGRRRRG